jgi:hypothetical protein
MKQSLGAAGRMWQNGGAVDVSCAKSHLEAQATVVFRLVAPFSNRYHTLVDQQHLTCPEGPMDRQVRRSQCTEKWQCTHELHSALSVCICTFISTSVEHSETEDESSLPLSSQGLAPNPP